MCPHSIRLVTHGYEDIYGITMQDAKIFQSVISPKGDKNPLISEGHKFHVSIEVWKVTVQVVKT